MPTEHGRGRYLMAALLLALEAPVLSVIASVAVLPRAPCRRSASRRPVSLSARPSQSS